MDIPTLEHAQALRAANRLPAETLPDFAVDLLMQGHDSPALRELAGLVRPTMRDAGPLFDRVVSEFGRKSMDRDAAVRFLALDLAERVCAGGVDPIGGAAEGEALARSFGYPVVLAPFCRFLDDYACTDETAEPIEWRAEIETMVVRYCEEILQELGEQHLAGPDYPAFGRALGRFKRFLESQGLPTSVLWVHPKRIRQRGRTLDVAVDPDNERARSEYEFAASERRGVEMLALGTDRNATIAVVYAPADDAEAESMLMPDGLKLSIPCDRTRVRVIRRRWAWWWAYLLGSAWHP